MKRFALLLPLLLVTVMCLAACAPTPKRQWAQAQATWDEALTIAENRLSPKDLKAALPVIEAGEAAMTAYRKAVFAGDTNGAAAARAAYDAARQALAEYLATKGVQP